MSGGGLDLVLRGRRVVTPSGERACSVGVAGGRIVAVEPLPVGPDGRPDGRPGAGPDAAEVVELGDDVVLLPGLVDTHVHVNEPGRTEWEGFATRDPGGRRRRRHHDRRHAAQQHPADRRRRRRCEVKRAAATGQVLRRRGLLGRRGPRQPRPTCGALHDEGVFGFKCFLLHSGVEEFPPLDRGRARGRLREVAALRRRC